MRYLILIAIVTGCATEPATSVATDQLCMLDPTTGQCYRRISESQAERSSSEWVADNYQNAESITVGCDRGTGGWGCSVQFDWGDWQYDVGCSLWDDGSVDCYEVDGPS